MHKPAAEFRRPLDDHGFWGLPAKCCGTDDKTDKDVVVRRPDASPVHAELKATGLSYSSGRRAFVVPALGHRPPTAMSVSPVFTTRTG